MASGLRDQYAEIQRRESIPKGVHSEDFLQEEEEEEESRLLAGGEYILLTMGTAILAPRPLDPLRPALRIYGSFQRREDALEHGKVIQQKDERCSLLVVKRSTWVLMPRYSLQVTPETVNAKVEADRASRLSKGAAFRELVDSKGFVPPSESVTRDPERDKEEEDAEREVYGPPQRISEGAEVRGQTIAVVCCIQDQKDGECLIRVMGCFESDASANDWIRRHGQYLVPHHDLMMTPLCEWVFPNGEYKSASTTYRNSELQSIIDSSKNNSRNVKTYEQWKKASSVS